MLLSHREYLAGEGGWVVLSHRVIREYLAGEGGGT